MWICMSTDFSAYMYLAVRQINQIFQPSLASNQQKRVQSWYKIQYAPWLVISLNVFSSKTEQSLFFVTTED
jgi:hypothetical protein